MQPDGTDSAERSPDPAEDSRTPMEIAAAIREEILAGGLGPGERLHQDRMAEMFGVSRTPLRTALEALSQQGLVDHEVNRGYRVKAFPVEDIIAAVDVRARLEGQACLLAGQRGLAPDCVERLRALVAEGDRILSHGQLRPDLLPAYRRMNVDFHETIIAASGNRWIGDFVRLTHNVPMASDRVFLWENFGIILRSHDDHHRIVRALARGDGARAEQIMIEHVRYAGDLLRAHLDPAGDGGTDAHRPKTGRRRAPSPEK